jgi:diaminohydroxyphosphoribosylaminopyrimidine deaminase/5-amino-6-(5-phosphoribosylamino)uracil reductase
MKSKATDPVSVDEDQRWMRAALLQARYALGRTAPNPPVGCVLVKDGVLIGNGQTQDGGRPHAETEAIADAGSAARGATAFVTLEPCAHHGQTPPCAEALVDAGVARVVIACGDPDKRVAGQGVSILTKAGIAVTEGVLKDQAASILSGYFTLRNHHRPRVTVKIASSLDGRIALHDGRSQWITGERTRHFVHLLRSQHDAVMTAMGTVRADNPSLTCRLPGYQGWQPLRVVAASDYDLDPQSHLATSHDQGDVVIYVASDDRQSPHPVDVVQVPADHEGRPDLHAILADLGVRGIQSVMVEAGGRFVASLLKAGLVDELVWTRSSGLIGGDGLASLASLGLENLSDGRMFKRVKTQFIGDDVIEIFHHQEYVNTTSH